MKAVLLALALTWSWSASATPQASDPSSQPIVVTGTRLQDLRDNLAACIARHCPPNEEIDAALGLAQAVFESGDYQEARRVIAASLGRNRRYAAHYPEPVADLFRARVRVARHLGRDEEATRSVYDILRSLRAGLPQEDYRHFTARLEIAEMLYTRTGGDPADRVRSARRELIDLARRATAAGRHDVADLANLRVVWMNYLLAPAGPAISQLIEISNDRDVHRRVRAIGAKIMLARIYSDQGDRQRSDALIDEVARTLAGRRDLIFAPRYELPDMPGLSGMTMNAEYEDKWIDVGFWIGADGHVNNMQIVRSRGPQEWSAPLLRSIRGRVYSSSPDHVPTYRLERYTYTAGIGTMTGTRLSARIGNPRIEYYDLSDGTPPPPISAAATR